MRSPIDNLRKYVLGLAAIFTTAANAQNQLRILSNEGLFVVLMNELPVNTTPQAEVVINNVLKDTLYLKVAFENSRPAGLSFYLMDKGKHTNGQEFSYHVTPANGRVKLKFMGMRPMINPAIHLLPPKPSPDTTVKYRHGVIEGFCMVRNGKPVCYYNVPPDGKCENAMPEEFMVHTRALIAKAATADQRFRIAEDVARNNCLDVEQLRELLAFIPYEIEKLKLVKVGYFHLIDPNNAERLASEFRFESSRNQFHEFIANSEIYREKLAASCSIPSEVPRIQKFGELLSTYNADVQRLEALRKSYGEYCFSVENVKQILSLFLHDAEKLAAARLVYFRCTNKETFMEIEDVFSYKQSVRELEEFVKNAGGK